MRILILGDICLSGEPEHRALKEQGYNPWEGIESLIREDTIVIANLECALTRNGTPIPNKWATLRADPHCIHLLKHLDVAVLSNNHISDFGKVGVQDTINALESASILPVGYGETLDAAVSAAIVEHDGTSIGIVALCCPTTNGENLATPSSCGVAPLGFEVLKKCVIDTRCRVDVLLVYLHWGVEQSHFPVPEQISLAHHAVDWGADAVVGCHAHAIQGYEYYHNKAIFYSLGNFLFGTVDVNRSHEGISYLERHNPQPCNQESLVVEFKLVKGKTGYQLELAAVHPVQYSEDYIPKLTSWHNLTVDMNRLNTRLSKYVNKNRSEIGRSSEPNLRATIRNGVVAYFYNSETIDTYELRIRIIKFFLGRIGYLGSQLRRLFFER